MRKDFFYDILPDDIGTIYPHLHQDDERRISSAVVVDKKAKNVSSAEKRVKTSLYITPALLRRLKVYCARESITMADVLEECISAYLQRKERLADKHNSSNND